VNCSKCGSVVAADAGFCRSCSAILRGKGASATLVPAAPAQGPGPPAVGPEPPTPALADAGYWAPPAAAVVLDGQPGYNPYGQTAPPPQPAVYFGQPQTYSASHGSTALPPGAHTVATFTPGSAWAGPAVTISDLKANRRLQMVDLASLFGTCAVFGSLFMPWYQIAVSGDGMSVSLSVTALHYPAGGLWRWLMLFFSIAVVVELVLTRVILQSSRRIEWPHRSLLALLCVANLALVVGAMVVSPFDSVGLVGLPSSLASGAYVGLAGGLVGVVAAVLRLFTGPPALSR
jgi:hypothetical protein